jgi:HSP20 family protein
MSRLFEESFVRPALLGEGNGLSRRALLVPPASVWEDADGFGIEFIVPDVDPQTLDVTFENDSLQISGSYRRLDEERRWLLQERPQGDFRRSIGLGVPVNADKSEATYRDGILTIHVPKSEAVKPRKIAVRNLTSPAPNEG